MTFEYDKCSEATIIAMQVGAEKQSHEFTFEKWMPSRVSSLNVPVMKDTDEPFCGPMFCYLCICVNSIFSLLWEEVIDHAADGLMTASKYFDSQQNKLYWSTQGFRALGLTLAVAGLYLIFTPLIVVLNGIPLIGFLLGSVAKLAAVLIALIAGVTISVFVIAVAWLFFRPLFSLALLTISGISTYLIFY